MKCKQTISIDLLYANPPLTYVSFRISNSKCTFYDISHKFFQFSRNLVVACCKCSIRCWPVHFALRLLQVQKQNLKEYIHQITYCRFS